MPGVLLWIGQALASFIGSSAIRFLAWKTLIIALLTTVLPIVLNKIIYAFIERAINYCNQSVGSVSAVTVNIVGMGGYLANQLNLPECVSIVLGFVAARFTLRIMRVM